MRKTLSFIFVIALLALTVLNVQPAMAWDGEPFHIGGAMKWYTGTGFHWTIEKSADQTELNLAPGQLFGVNYEVTVVSDATITTYGTIAYIKVHNNDTVYPATIKSVKLIMPGNVVYPATCPLSVLNPWSDVTNPMIPGEYTICVTEPIALPNNSTIPVTFEATLTINGTDYTRSVPDNIDFSMPGRQIPPPSSAVVDECVDVTDTNVGFLGEVCVGDAPKTFTYTLDFGTSPDADVVVECGENTHTNIASFVTNDTGATGSDDAVVTTTVACGGGCSLTQGYWKTHSSFGPAPYDDTWAMVGENTIFFLSGQSWMSVFNTAPAGNPYYILAHQYMAAVLNQLNGASVPANVATAMTDANAFFTAYGPDASLTKTQKQMITALATVLDNYNNGLIGPGHCSE